MATLTVKNLTTASGQDLALRTGGTDRLTISSSDGSVTIGGGLALGPSPASSGYLRIPNNQSITARNAANTGNVNLIGLNSSDQIVFGTGLSLGDQSITNVYSISQTTSSNWNISNAGAATFASTVSAGGMNITSANANINVGTNATSTQDCSVHIGPNRTGTGASYVDLIGDTTYTDFGARLIRWGGANALTELRHRGTGWLALITNEAADIRFSTTESERMRISSGGLVTLTRAGAELYVGNTNTSTESCLIQIGNGRTGSGQSYIDFIGDTTYTDFGMRLSRDGGANGSSYIQHRGTGDLTLLGQDASAISLRTNNTERLRITSTGSVGIGTASPAVSLQTSDDVDTSDRRIRCGTNARYVDIIRNASVDNWIRSVGNTDFIIDQNAAGNLIFRTGATERMRITSGGNIGINTSSPNNFLTIATSTADLGITLNGIGSGNRPRIIFQTGGVNKTAIFCDNGGFTSGSADSLVCQTGSGGVYLANGGTSWTAVSDVRFKKNIQPLHYGLSEIKNIETIRFDYLEDDSETSARIGFSAQSVFPNIPEAVAGTLDTKLGVSAVELVPVLVRAIQQLAEKVESLESQVASLSVT